MTSDNLNQQNRMKAILLLVITAILWSAGGLLIKLVNAHPLAIAGSRSAIAAVVIFMYLKNPKINWSLPQIGAALAYAGTVIFFVCANKMTTAANAILLQFTAPIYTALLGAWLLKEKTRLADWVTIAFTMGGMALFFLDNLDTRGVFGNMIALLSGVSFACFAVFMRMQKEGSPLESVLMGNILTALIGLPFLFLGLPNQTGWISLALLGVVQLGIPYILYAKAVKQLSALETILIPVLEPILNPVWVFLTIGEFPGLLSIAGGVVVIAAVTLRCLLPVFGKAAKMQKQPMN